MLQKVNHIIFFSFLFLTGSIVVPGYSQSSEIEWEQLDPYADEEDIADFISTSRFEENKEKASLLVKENFPKLEFTSERNGNTIVATIVNPFFKPRFKDISHSDGLRINDDSWQENHTLKIEILKNEDYKILLRDNIGREAIIPFGNTFEADMEVSDSTYLINILGEERPFHIELVNNATQSRQTFITHADHIVFNKATLLKNGLSGEYAVKVGYGNNRRTMELDQPIYLEKKRSFKSWITGFLIVAIIAIGVFLVRIFTRKKPEEPIRLHK